MEEIIQWLVENPLLWIAGLFLGVVVYNLARSIRIVPPQTVQVVERLGKYERTLSSGFNLLVPFIEKVQYKHSLKEVAIDVPAQSCFTEDNVKVRIDGVLYMKVMDPYKASYGIKNFRYATIQLAQTMMRSVIGQLELDKTFEERDQMNASIVVQLDEATDPWGVQVTRYEIQNITVPRTILQTMELQVKAERDKRAAIARSIGEMESRINYSIGIMEEAINKSEGEMERRINEAEGRASEILAIAKANAASIEKIAGALNQPGGPDAVTLQLVENYIKEFKKLSKSNSKVVLPLDLTNLTSLTDFANQIFEKKAEL
jgi:regulator of protease activity HflC (stomatin/prohibitin superfamily)